MPEEFFDLFIILRASGCQFLQHGCMIRYGCHCGYSHVDTGQAARFPCLCESSGCIPFQINVHIIMPAIGEHLTFYFTIGNIMIQYCHLAFTYLAADRKTHPFDRMVLLVELHTIGVGFPTDGMELAVFFKVDVPAIRKKNFFDTIPYTGSFFLDLLGGKAFTELFPTNLDIGLEAVFRQPDIPAYRIQTLSQLRSMSGKYY